MKTTGRFVALALVSVLLAGACTGDGDEGNGNGNGGTGGTGGSGATGQDATGPTPVVSGSATSGRYEYENAGLHVTLDVDGTDGTLEVDNRTGHELEAPDFYILHATEPGVRIEGEVTGAEPVPAGETASFEVSFQGVEVGDIGAIALLFGADNYGLFVRTG
jgi:hypothetical protein